MKVPKSINILGRKLTIKVGANLHYQGQACLGLFDYEKKTIYLEKNQSSDSMRDTLYHKACHYFLLLSGMDQKMSESEIEMYCQLITAFVNDMKQIK